jgi:hypothetical protein
MVYEELPSTQLMSTFYLQKQTGFTCISLRVVYCDVGVASDDAAFFTSAIICFRKQQVSLLIVLQSKIRVIYKVLNKFI